MKHIYARITNTRNRLQFDLSHEGGLIYICIRPYNNVNKFEKEKLLRRITISSILISLKIKNI